MVLANDFSDDKKSVAGSSSAIEPQLEQPSIETDSVPPTIPGSSYGDFESSIGTWTEDKPPDYSTLTSAGKALSSVARVTSDGRLAVSLKFKQTLPDLPKDYAVPIDEFAIDPTLSEPGAGNGIRAGGRVPQLNIVVMLIGSQGDIEPHLALGQELSKHGHRVRIATHGAFQGIVSHAGLEFFNIGGDPNELMGYMMRNSGLVSGFASLNRGDITRNRRSMKEILDGCSQACTQTADPSALPFIADAIIANPPAFAHVHCAEALGIPVHITSTMPWSPTTAFPHPLVNISHSNGEPRLTNYLSYALAELMIWQGLGGIINNFRKNTLGLKALNMRTGAGVLDKLKIPCTYGLSESLVPKPEDWKNHIDVAGFFCQEQDIIYTPSPELIEFISSGPPPIYLNFGSAPIPDPLAFTHSIIESARVTGTRILLVPLSPNSSAFPFSSLPPHAFLLPPDVPASALLPYTCAALHAGDAQLTAAILRAGKPSVVVPCVGDQTFWAWALHRAGAAARPVEKGLLSGGGKVNEMSKGVLVLKEAIEVALSRQVVENARMIGDRIGRENGIAAGVHSFHRHLPLLNMRCDLLPERVAVWWSPKHYLRLSAFAAQILAEVGLLDIQDLRLHRTKEYIHDPNFADPISGGVVEVFRSIVDFHVGLAQIFREPVQGLINTGVALPRGVFYSIDSIQEGIHHTPRLWGSKTRYEKPIKDWKGGMAEGGKALFHGVVDGIAGLVTEPIDGYKNEGTIGALKGTGRGLLNVGLRPAAGSLALVTKPVKGAFFSIMSSFTPSTNTTTQLRSARIAEGVEQSARASDTEKLEVVKRWQSEVMKVRLKERRKDWKKAKEEEQDGWILRSEHATGGSGGIVGRYTAEGSSMVPHGHEHGREHARTYSGSSAPSEAPQSPQSPMEPPMEPTMEPPAYEGVREYQYPGEKADGSGQRMLELEQSIAEAERRGYQRGLEEASVRNKGKQKAP